MPWAHGCAGTVQVTADTGRDGMRELGQFNTAGGFCLRQTQRAAAGTVHPVQKQHMKMNIQVQCAAEALDQGHGAGLCCGLCEACLAGQMRGDGAVDNGQRPGHDSGVAVKQEPARWLVSQVNRASSPTAGIDQNHFDLYPLFQPD